MPRTKPPEPTHQVAFRLAASLIEEIDRYAATMTAQMIGIRATRADAARALLMHGLEAVRKGSKPRKR